MRCCSAAALDAVGGLWVVRLPEHARYGWCSTGRRVELIVVRGYARVCLYVCLCVFYKIYYNKRGRLLA